MRIGVDLIKADSATSAASNSCQTFVRVVVSFEKKEQYFFLNVTNKIAKQ